MFGFPQGLILRPSLFNIFICDLFLFANHIYNAPYTASFKLNLATENLKSGVTVFLHGSKKME